MNAEEIKQLYDNNSITVCCQILGCSKTKLYKILKSYGIGVKSPHPKQTKSFVELKQNISKKQIVEVQKKYSQTKYILDALGINRTAYYRLCKHYGLDLNKRTKFEDLTITKEEFLKLVQTKSLEEICTQLGISEKLEKKLCKKFNTHLYTDYERLLLKIDSKAYLADLQQKYNQNELCKQYNISLNLYNRLCKHYGLNTPMARLMYRVPKTMFLNLVEYNQAKDICRLLNISYDTYSLLCKHYNVVLRQNIDFKQLLQKLPKQNILEEYKIQQHSIENISQQYGILKSQLYRLLKYYEIPTNTSEPNNRFAELLTQHNISYGREIYLNNYFYDFRVGNALIEINPTETHNVDFSPFGQHLGINKQYHQNKTQAALKANYRCIHIWDWDNSEKIVALLESKPSIYARKCVVKEVPQQQAKIFVEHNHIQGYVKDDIRLGLYYNNELVSIMTFGKPRYNNKYEYELIRYCASCVVIGGANKIFKHFIDTYQPKSVISYCDLSKFSGEIYQKLGFKLLIKNKPSVHWYNIDTKQHITDNLLRQRGFDQLFGTTYGKGTSNVQLMLENGFLRVYDCGQATYVWKN